MRDNTLSGCLGSALWSGSGEVGGQGRVGDRCATCVVYATWVPIRVLWGPGSNYIVAKPDNMSQYCFLFVSQIGGGATRPDLNSIKYKKVANLGKTKQQN